MKENPTLEKLATDPLVKDGGFQPALKVLYIAKGSFCEPKQVCMLGRSQGEP